MTLKVFNEHILGFHSIPRDTKDNRHSGHVVVPNKRNNQNSFIKSTPTWPSWRQVKNQKLSPFVATKQIFSFVRVLSKLYKIQVYWKYCCIPIPIISINTWNVSFNSTKTSYMHQWSRISFLKGTQTSKFFLIWCAYNAIPKLLEFLATRWYVFEKTYYKHPSKLHCFWWLRTVAVPV